MSNIINKQNVLVLNALYQPLGVKTIKSAFIDLMGGRGDESPPASAIEISYVLRDGYPTEELEFYKPVPFEEWLTFPVRPWDEVIHTSKKEIRVPTVIINHYKKMPMKHFKVTKNAIRERDKNVCQYTGKILGKNQGNIDHIVPQKHGGKDTWENMVWCDKEINSLKGDKRNEEIGLKLIRPPVAPRAMPVSALIKEIKSRDWRLFL